MADETEQSPDPGPPRAEGEGSDRAGGDRRRPVEVPGLATLARQLEETTAAIGQLRLSVDGERESRERTIAAWNQRIEESDKAAGEAKIAATTASRATTTASRAMKLAAFVACIALIAAILAWNSSSTANRAVTDFAANRTSSRIVACLSANETAHKINEGNAAQRAILDADREVQAEIDSLLAPIKAQQPTDAATQQYLTIAEASRLKVTEKLNTAEAKINEANVPDRVCTADAVNEFFDGPPTTLTTTPSSGSG